MFLKKRTAPHYNQVLMLIDWPNLFCNTNLPHPEQLSFEKGFDRLARKIAQDVGKIVGVFVFAPPDLASTWADLFHKQQFYTVVCPKVRAKNSFERKETVDETIVDFARQFIPWMPTITHLCIATGDIDLLPIGKLCAQNGLELLIVTGSYESLSKELANNAARLRNNRQGVYLFSPTE